MITIPELTSQALGAFLMSETKGRFGSSYASLPELLPYAAKLALECIGNSDALYHNVEHTMLVTLVGHDILIGRALLRPSTGSDYAHFILACLIHDIGYVRGIIHGDQDGVYVVSLHGSAQSSLWPDTVRDNRVDSEEHKGRMQTGRRTAHVGSRLKLPTIPEGTAWKANLPAVLGKTRRTE